MIETLCVPVKTIQRAVANEKTVKQEESIDFGALIGQILCPKDSAAEEKERGVSLSVAESDDGEKNASDSSAEQKETGRPEMTSVLAILFPADLFPQQCKPEGKPEGKPEVKAANTAAVLETTAGVKEIKPNQPMISESKAETIQGRLTALSQSADEETKTVGTAIQKDVPREEKAVDGRVAAAPKTAEQALIDQTNRKSGLSAAEIKYEAEKTAYTSDSRENPSPEAKSFLQRDTVIKGHAADVKYDPATNQAGTKSKPETAAISRDTGEGDKKSILRAALKSEKDIPEQKTKTQTMQIEGTPVKADFSLHKIHPSKEEAIDTGQTDIANQIGARISQFALKDGTNTFRMKLYPEGLGEISVTMVCKNSKLTLHIQTDNTAAQKLIEDRAGELKTALLTKNFEVTDLRVGAGQNAADNMRGGFSFFRQDSQNGAYDQNDGRPTYGHFENRPRTEETPLFKTWEDLYTPGRLNYRA